MGISSLRTANFAMRNWALGLGRILFKFCTAISTKSGCTDPLVWLVLQHHHQSTRGLAGMFPSQGISGQRQFSWPVRTTDKSWIFFHYRVPNCALGDSEVRSASTHCAMKGKQSLSSNSFHFKFPFVLLHSFSISTCFGVHGRRRKQE